MTLSPISASPTVRVLVNPVTGEVVCVSPLSNSPKRTVRDVVGAMQRELAAAQARIVALEERVQALSVQALAREEEEDAPQTVRFGFPRSLGIPGEPSSSTCE